MLKLSRSDLRTRCAESPLLLAIYKEDEVAFRLLHSKEETRNCYSSSSLTPLHVSVTGSNLNILRHILTNHSTQLSDSLKKELQASQNRRAETAEELAAQYTQNILLLKQKLTAMNRLFDEEDSALIRRTQFQIEVYLNIRLVIFISWCNQHELLESLG